MNDDLNLDAAPLARAVRAGAVSAVDVTRAALDRIAAADDALHCCTTVMSDQALADAASVDAGVREGRDPGPLCGVPFVVKNLFDVHGVTTLAGAKMRLGQAPAAQDATLVRRLRGAGAILLAATNMDEFAYGFTTENDHFGTTRNPRDTQYLAGGSSGGAAAAVAAGMANIGLGSDTNGSIRIPAAFTGIFGLKPTFGRLSRAGAYPFVASLDHVGPMARTVADLALAYDVLQGPDLADPVCAVRSAEPVAHLLKTESPGLRVGVLDGWFAQGAQDDVLEALDVAARCLGASARVELPESDLARAAAFLITASEGGALHLDRLRACPEDFDPATRARLMAGALAPAAHVIQAHRFRRRYAASAQALFKQFDILLAPATPYAALKIGQRTVEIAGETIQARPHLGVFTQPLSFIGLPVVLAPMAKTGGMPIGVQIVAAPWQEARAFEAAAILERAQLTVGATA